MILSTALMIFAFEARLQFNVVFAISNSRSKLVCRCTSASFSFLFAVYSDLPALLFGLAWGLLSSWKASSSSSPARGSSSTSCLLSEKMSSSRSSFSISASKACLSSNNLCESSWDSRHLYMLLIATKILFRSLTTCSWLNRDSFVKNIYFTNCEFQLPLEYPCSTSCFELSNACFRMRLLYRYLYSLKSLFTFIELNHIDSFGGWASSWTNMIETRSKYALTSSLLKIKSDPETLFSGFEYISISIRIESLISIIRLIT
mmetsp:Transcript_26412/g.30535  ORF Transcript_26412/g.30535 Transcript_26412/m.30535 type:complete len:260 (-) Transcript_26412:1623-2402(-)